MHTLLANHATSLNLIEIYSASPVIYSILLALSLLAFITWFYSLLTLRKRRIIPPLFLQQIRSLILEKKYDAALTICGKKSHFAGAILASALRIKEDGRQAMVEAIQKEGKRCGVTLWQRISLLNDVAVVAPMLGLLGTVLGLFYAFYDVNQTPDTLSSIFDGLGIAVGTTVAGLVVAILAMVFCTSLKFKTISLLNELENETLSLIQEVR